MSKISLPNQANTLTLAELNALISDADAENTANKSTTLSTDQASDTKYPSVKAVYDWAIGLFGRLTGTTETFYANLVFNETV